ncbi:transposase [Chryseobacterium sp. Tr-659]|uniref:transposase n=1 Tax=Chryseobacterium sp. Tr-659 TaxID=2608340 RepID=UPI00141F0E10|nr:transposase [Chryseobacterium sp. Tr-659]NIF06670.1 transposase [Chryseobacterium sp. Tr-659]
MDLKNINIGYLIKCEVENNQISIERISKFLKCDEEDIEEMYKQKDLPTELLLKWSKLLEYDFFRLYSQHLILYAPQKKITAYKDKKNGLPIFRKNLYTTEMIRFILEMLRTGEKTKEEILKEYRIPRTTLHKWNEKY